MAFQEFKGKLDEPAGTGFVPFTGQLDELLKKPIQSDPILSPEDVVMSSVGAPSAEPPQQPRKPVVDPRAQRQVPALPDIRGTISRIGDFLRPEYQSVLEAPVSPEQQQLNVDRRLTYGAGPISHETEAAAAAVLSGEAEAKNQTVKKVANAMAKRGQPSLSDLIARTKNPEVIRAARDAKAEEFRSAGEWAADTLSNISQGTVGLVQLPLNIFAPSGELAQTLRNTQKELQEQESDVLKAQRAQLLERVQNEDGFFGKYFATVESLITNPALGISEAVKQVPNFLSIMGVAKLGGALTGEAINTASRFSPTIALSEAISGNALLTGARAAGTTAGGISAATLMTSGDAAGNTYQTLTDLKKTPMSVWRTNPDFQQLVAQGRTPRQAIEEIATAKARLAAAIVAPLGVLGFMGAESAILAQPGTRAALQAVTPKGAAKIFGKEIGLEQIEEGGTQAGSNVASQTINPQQSLTEGVPEAMATAAVTAAPFAGAAVARQALQSQQTQADLLAEAEARRRLDVQSYDPNLVDPTSTKRPPSTGPVTITPPDEEPFTAPPPPPAPMPPAPGGRIEPNFDEAPPAARPPVDVIPGMMTDEDVAQPENLTVTPVTLTEPEVTPVTLPEPEVTPVTPIQPTLAAELLPETPTVPPAQTPKLFEPSIGEHQAQDMTVVAVPVKELTLSKDVPQFKAGASSKGVVEPLSGKFTQEGVAPIAVWRRLDGAMEVISGRHRLDLAKRSNTDLINAQVYDEAKGFNQSMAATLDAELNIRDEQGKVKDYVNYFKESGTDRETADAKGFLARTKGKRGFTIANQGSDALIAAINSDQIGDEAAYYVAINAPNDERLQSVGIKALMDGKSMNTATNTMQAVKAMAGEQDTTTDMFGFDDSLIKEAQEMAKIAAQMQQAIKNRLSAITGAAKNPAMAKAEGIDVRDPAAIQQRIEELKQRKTALENWSTSPELVAEIRAARGVAPPVLPIFEQPVAPVDTQDDFLSMQTPEELRKRAEAQAEAARQQAIAGQEAQRKAQADSEVDDFALTGSDRAADVAVAQGQEDLFGAAQGTEEESGVRGASDKAPAILEEDLPEAIAEEKEFIEEDTKDKLEAIAQDFMVGDMVRFGSIPGTVVGVEGDYVRMRPDDAKSAKAYQRVPKSSLTFVGRPDTTTMVSYSKEQDNKFGEEAGQLNANMGNLIQLLGANMYSSSLAEVTVKELLQNAFDAVKGAVADTNAKGESIKPLYKTGKIQIAINTNDRTISITDNARGMTPQIVRDAFFTVAGSDKSDLPPGQRSGGLGLAKMGFMLGAENLKLDTVRDGVRVTVDTSSTDIANNNFKIQKSPAPKGEHGTTVTVKIPQYYIDPKNGDEKPIYFPYSLRSIGALNKPLIGPVKVSFKRDTDESAILPIGVNFEKKNYTQFKANFDWGSADIFFGIERKPDQYSINHQVLSAGVYQFSPSFKLDDELIPYDIIVNIAPNVDARHPDYPFVNSRESFKDRIKKDVEALQQYLGQISRGLEAKDLQESFKGVVSMPRMEAGQDIANIADKLKKTFGEKKQEKPTAVKALPKEVTVTADAVTDTQTQQILVDVKAKQAEKQKDASFKGSEAPKATDFMLDLKQDPKLPAYHNNTNVDYLAIGRPYGEPEQFFAELGTLVVEMKEELAKSGFYGYEKLSPESLFFAGVSIDKKYGGVHIRVPYKAIFVNPFYSFGGRTIFGIRQQLLNTMMHEIAHTGSMDHGVAHNTQMIKVEQYLADEGLLDYYRDAILDILRRHESTFTAMKEAYDKSSTQNTSKSLEDYAQDSSAASARGDEGGARNAPSAIPSRERQGRGEGVSRAQADDAKRQDRKGAREDGKDGKPSDFLMNVEKPEDITEEPSLAEQGEDLIVGSKAIREWQIGEYARLRAQLARVPKQVAEGKVDLRMQAAVTRLMQQARDLNSEIKSTKPRRDSAEQFLAKAALEFDKGNISEDVFNVIKMAYDKMPDVLEGLLLSVKSQGEKKTAAGQFLAFERIVRLYKGTSGIDDLATIRHELAHSLEQMMNPEQRLAVAQAWVKGLLAAIKRTPDETHQKYFNAVMDFIDSPSETNFRKAVKLLPSYEMYQFINPSEFWAVNAEKLMAAELGTAWEKFKRAIARLWEGIKNVVGFDNRYVVQKMFKDIMNGSRNRITTDMLVDLVGGTGVKFNVLENIEDDKKLLEKHSRPNTPQLDSSPLRTQIINSSKLGKEFLKLAVTDPLGALGTAANSVDRAVVYARNKNVWFGSGLNSADFSKYNGELLNSQGLATASVALDNAIRGGQIASEVIFQGGIKFDPKSRNFVAVQRDKGMRGVYEAEAALKKRLGNQLGTDIIQGYLEAKRSRSIQNEYFQREAEYEFAKNEYEDLQATGASEKDIMVARNAMVDAREDLKAIEVVYKKISMSEEEIDDFIERDTVHPELRKIMQNWSAINQNMLAFWRQVGLLSESRYDNLSNIKDYVPWQRIMNDETDIHSPVQTTNRKMTNIGLEKLFKKGKPTVITDVVAKDGQQDFKIQPATEVDVEINGNPVAPDKVTMTADGKVKVDMPITKGDLVVFKASREIENIIDNMTRNVMRMTMNGLRQAAAQRIVMEYATRDKNQKIMVFPKADKERGRFDFIVSGQRIVVEIQDPLIAESIFGMESLNLVMLKPLAAVANFTRRTITLSGAFQIKQVFKDAPTAALVTGVKHPLLLIGGVYKGFVTSLTNTDPTIKILKAAGIGGFQSAARTPEAEIKRRLGIMNRNVFDFMIKGLDHIGDSSDMAQRVAVYKRVLAERGDETQALYQAANVINFLHHGSGQVSQMVVKTVPFAGAYANSMDVLIQALAGGGLKGRSRSSALARLAMTGTLLTGITLLYCMMVGDDDEYNQMDDQTKLRNFMIPGTKIILPMNTSAAYFYKAVPEMIYNKIMKEGTKDAVDERRLRTALKEAAIDMLLGPTPVPSGIKPFIEIGLNKNFFTGRPVVPESLAKLDAAERYMADTSEAGKFLSSLTGTKEKRILDPIEADHIIKGLFGTAGAMAQWFSNSIAVSTGERVAMTDKQTPLTGSFLRADVGRRNEDLFYDFKSLVDNKYGTYSKMLEREDEKQADAYEKKHGNILDFYKEVNKIDSELKEINSEIRYYGESKDTRLTPDKRRQEIKLLQLEKQELLEETIEMRKEAGL